MLTTHTIRVDGRLLQYAVEGQGPPLLLLHSFPFDYRIWAPAIPYLVGQHRVIAPDLPGFGGSEAGPGWSGTPEALLRPVAALMTALNIVPAGVAGVSLGGSLALALAIHYPERVRAVAAFAPPAIRRWPRTGQARLARLALTVPGLVARSYRLLPRLQACWILRTQLGHTRPLPGELIELARVHARNGGGRRIELVLRHWDDWRHTLRNLAAVRARTLLVWGEHDRLFSLADGEALRRAIPHAQLITLPQAEHLPMIEHPAVIAALLRDWFGS